MSYPMTWQRVVKRNGLEDGDYGVTPTAIHYDVAVNKNPADDGEPMVAQVRREALVRLTGRFQNLAGDLRRLERDSQDERATCKYIAARIGVDEDTVAAVLKEFLAW